VEELACQHLGPHLVELKLEGDDDAEIATPTPEAQEEVGVLLLARVDERAVGRAGALGPRRGAAGEPGVPDRAGCIVLRSTLLPRSLHLARKGRVLVGRSLLLMHRLYALQICIDVGAVGQVVGNGPIHLLQGQNLGALIPKVFEDRQLPRPRSLVLFRCPTTIRGSRASIARQGF